MRCQTAAASRDHWAADPRPHLITSLLWHLMIRQRLRRGYRMVRMWLLSASVVAALLLAGLDALVGTRAIWWSA